MYEFLVGGCQTLSLFGSTKMPKMIYGNARPRMCTVTWYLFHTCRGRWIQVFSWVARSLVRFSPPYVLHVAMSWAASCCMFAPPPPPVLSQFRERSVLSGPCWVEAPCLSRSSLWRPCWWFTQTGTLSPASFQILFAPWQPWRIQQGTRLIHHS